MDDFNFGDVPSLFTPSSHIGNESSGSPSGGGSSRWESSTSHSTDSLGNNKVVSNTVSFSGSGNGDSDKLTKAKTITGDDVNIDDLPTPGAAGASNGTENATGKRPKYLAGSGDPSNTGLSTGALVGGSSGGAHTAGSSGKPTISNSDTNSASGDGSSGSSTLLLGGSLAGVALVVLGAALLVAGVARKKNRERREERLAAKNRFSLPPLVSRGMGSTHRHRKSLVDIDLGHRNITTEEKNVGMPPPAVVNLGVPRSTPTINEPAGISSYIPNWWGSSTSTTSKPSSAPFSSQFSLSAFSQYNHSPPMNTANNITFGSLNQGGIRDSVGSVQDAQMNYTVHRLSEAELSKSDLRVMNRNSDVCGPEDEESSFITER